MELVHQWGEDIGLRDGTRAEWQSLADRERRVAQSPVGGETTDLTPLIIHGIMDMANVMISRHLVRGGDELDKIRWVKTTDRGGGDCFLKIYSESEILPWDGQIEVSGEVKRPLLCRTIDMLETLRTICRRGQVELSLDVAGDRLVGSEGLPDSVVKVLGQVSLPLVLLSSTR